MIGRRITGLLVLAALVAAAPASAHYVAPTYLSKINQVTPATKGVSLTIINRADQLQLTNRSRQAVVVTGYNDDPYARIEPDGTVSVNTQSPAYYLNNDYYATATVPKGVTGTGPPKWKTLDKTGRFQWHDHRIHWMGKGTPPQVKDKGVRTKIFNWKVPIAVSGKQGAIAGTLYWVPKPSAPAGLIIGIAVLVPLSVIGAVIVRRRRDASADPSDSEPAAEAW